MHVKCSHLSPPIAADLPCWFRPTFPPHLLSYLQKNGSVEVLSDDLRAQSLKSAGQDR